MNNAVIQHVAPIEEFPEEKWDAILAINIASAHGLTASPSNPHMLLRSTV